MGFPRRTLGRQAAIYLTHTGACCTLAAPDDVGSATLLRGMRLDSPGNLTVAQLERGSSSRPTLPSGPRAHGQVQRNSTKGDQKR